MREKQQYTPPTGEQIHRIVNRVVAGTALTVGVTAVGVGAAFISEGNVSGEVVGGVLCAAGTGELAATAALAYRFRKFRRRLQQNQP